MPKKSPYTPDAMRARFHELGGDRAAAIADLEPIQQRRDALLARIQPLEAELRAINEEMKTKRAPLFDIDQERAALGRALNGRTGAPPDAASSA